MILYQARNVQIYVKGGRHLTDIFVLLCSHANMCELIFDKFFTEDGLQKSEVKQYKTEVIKPAYIYIICCYIYIYIYNFYIWLRSMSC